MDQYKCYKCGGTWDKCSCLSNVPKQLLTQNYYIPKKTSFIAPYRNMFNFN